MNAHGAAPQNQTIRGGLTRALTLAVLALLCAGLTADPPTGVLQWHNGDALSGQLLGSDGKTIRWRAELFATPFELDLAALSNIQFPALEVPADKDTPFRIVTTNNDVFLGRWVGTEDQQFVIASPRHGQLVLDAHQVMGLQRHDRQAAGSVGLGLLSDWRTLHRGRQISEWSRGVDGRITSKVTGAELYRDLRLTSVSEIEVEFAWQGKPGFMISFAGPEAARLPKEVVKLETWENDLVLQTLGANGDFEVIMTIPENIQTLALRLQWNPNTGELAVSSSTGQLLGRMKGEPVPGTQLSGLYIQNKGAALDVIKLRATGWDGVEKNLPKDAVAIRLADASIAIGKIVGLDAAQQTLKLELVTGQVRPLALQDIDSVDLGHHADLNRRPAPVRVTFLDGTQISGELASMSEQTVTVQTSYSRSPVQATLDGVYTIRFAPPPEEAPKSSAALDVLHLPETRMRGTLVAISEQDKTLGWRPLGSRNASPLPTHGMVRVTRASTAVQEQEPDKRFADRIYLRNGDAVPCNIRQIDEQQIRVDVPLTENSLIDRTMAVAVAFGALHSAHSNSFEDPQWVLGADTGQQESKVKLNSETELEVSDTAVFGYDNIRDADDISFDVQWNMSVPAIVRVCLYADGPQVTGQSSCIMLYRTSGTQVMIQAVGGAGAMGAQIRGVTPVQTRNGSSSFRFRLRSDRVVLYESDKELLFVPIQRVEQQGRSLSISVQRLQINNVRLAAGDGQQSTAMVTIRNPVIRKAAGDVEEIGVAPELLQRVLTIPRFRKQSPPTEVLVGRNNDLLRGRLISLDDQRAVFVSRLEELVIPRDRLVGVIWPQTAEGLEETAKADAELARFLFTDGSVLRMTAEQLVGDAVVGQHPALGRLAVPLPSTREIAIGGSADDTQRNQFGNWVLRDALEPQVCASGRAGIRRQRKWRRFAVAGSTGAEVHGDHGRWFSVPLGRLPGQGRDSGLLGHLVWPLCEGHAADDQHGQGLRPGRGAGGGQPAGGGRYD